MLGLEHLNVLNKNPTVSLMVEVRNRKNENYKNAKENSLGESQFNKRKIEPMNLRHIAIKSFEQGLNSWLDYLTSLKYDLNYYAIMKKQRPKSIR